MSPDSDNDSSNLLWTRLVLIRFLMVSALLITLGWLITQFGWLLPVSSVGLASAWLLIRFRRRSNGVKKTPSD